MSEEKKEHNEVAKFGFENDTDLLSEVNYRLTLLNKNCIFIKKLPKEISRTSLKDMIPEMITCRFPEESENGNKNYAFVQLPNETLVNKYVEILNQKSFRGRKLFAKRLDIPNPCTSKSNLDLKTLFFNGLKPETKYREIKALYPKANITLPVDEDKMSLGYVRLKFNTEEEALSAFLENNLVLHGVKCHLCFLFKKNKKEALVDNNVFMNDDELLEEISLRLKAQNDRTIMVKNLSNTFNLAKLKKLVPSMRNCKINVEKKIGFIDFDNSEIANQRVKELNGKNVDGKALRAFIPKREVQYMLSEFNMKKLHLTNIAMTTTKDDIETIFPNCQVEVHLNTDNTCIGNVTLIYENEKDALLNFHRKDLKIKDVNVFINFHIEAKSVENVSKKRALDSSEDEKSVKVSSGKKMKVCNEGLSKKISPRETVNSLDTVTKELKVSVTPLSADNIDNNVNKKVLDNKKKIAVSKVANTAKTQVSIPKKVQTKSVLNKNEKKETVTLKDQKKIEKTKIAGPMKRKFTEVEKNETVGDGGKKTRVLAKRGVNTNIKENIPKISKKK